MNVPVNSTNTNQKEEALSNTALHHQDISATPFDKIRRVRPDGSEFWSARDLAPLMGYTQKNAWQMFKRPIERAIQSAENQGTAAQEAFIRSNERVPAGRGWTMKEDYELSRFAAYLVAMNGDPNKREVAAAQAYFAINTHENEVRKAQADFQLPTNFVEALEALVDSEKRNLSLEENIKELEPAAEFGNTIRQSEDTITIGDLAKALNTAGLISGGRTKLFEYLRDEGFLMKMGTNGHAPTQRYINQGLFDVAQSVFWKNNGEPGINYKTTVTPKGQEYFYTYFKDLALV